MRKPPFSPAVSPEPVATAPDRVDICLGFDAVYAPHAASTMASVVRRAPASALRFLILHSEVGRDLQAKVERAARGAEFVWIPVGDDLIPELADRDYISRATLYRLGLETLAPQDCRRLIYLDSDLTVLGDIRELWRQDLGGMPIGAVADPGVEGEAFGGRWGLAPGGEYFNAGVLLIDLEQVRARRLLSGALAFQIAHGADLPFSDQDALNWSFWKSWRALDRSWNVQRANLMPATETERRAPLHERSAATNIVHFTQAWKPWLKETWHPWSWIYWDNLSRTPFLRDIARRHGVTAVARFRMWLRWMNRRPLAL